MWKPTSNSPLSVSLLLTAFGLYALVEAAVSWVADLGEGGDPALSIPRGESERQLGRLRCSVCWRKEGAGSEREVDAPLNTYQDLAETILGDCRNLGVGWCILGRMVDRGLFRLGLGICVALNNSCSEMRACDTGNTIIHLTSSPIAPDNTVIDGGNNR